MNFRHSGEGRMAEGESRRAGRKEVSMQRGWCWSLDSSAEKLPISSLRDTS